MSPPEPPPKTKRLRVKFSENNIIGAIWVSVVAAEIIIALIWQSYIPDYFWIAWEAAAVVGTILLSIVMIWYCFIREPRLVDILPRWMVVWARTANFIGMFALVMALVIGATDLIISLFDSYPALHKKFVDVRSALTWLPVYHLFSLVVGTGAFLAVNFIIGHRALCEEDIQNKISGKSIYHGLSTEEYMRRYQDLVQEAALNFQYSDLPAFATFIIMCGFAIFAVEIAVVEVNSLEAFIGGMIAFQLLASNVIFGWTIIKN